MKNDKGRKVAHQISSVLEAEYEPEKVVLFGSFATGSVAKDSDIDLLIVKRTTVPFYKRLSEVRKIVSSVRRGFSFDPIVMTPTELTHRLKMGDRFLKDILRSGKVLYAKG